MLSSLQPTSGIGMLSSSSNSDFHEPGIWPQQNMRELTFYRQNRRGKPLKISREKYLRDDLHCGSLGCSTCIPSPSIKSVVTLDANPIIKSIKFPVKHYLLPDAGFILRQLDVIEELDNVILLQVVMEQVFRFNATKYKRLRDGYKTKKMSYFLNEHHRTTYIERHPNESPEDRNQRAFLTAYNYFQTHFAPLGIQVIILSDDPEFKTKHKTGVDVIVASGEEYVSGLVDEIRMDLEDKLCRIPFHEDESINKFTGSSSAGDFCYPPHLHIQDVQDGIKTGKFAQGSFRTFNFFEGFVRIDGDSTEAREILIQGLENVNRATDGDIVAIEILSQEQWSAPSGMVVMEDLADEPPLTPAEVLEEPEAEGEETKLLEQVHQKQKELEKKDKEFKKATGRVIGIIRRKWSPICGVIRESINPNSSTHFFIPDNKKIPRVKIETRNVSRFSGQKILVQIDSWPPSSRYPVGHYLKVLGKAGDLETETSAVLHEHGVPHGPFSAAVEACLPSLPYLINEEEISSRTDFRDLTIVSVDPPGCTDIDDALHCIHLPDGNYQVGVHIADVSNYIEPGTALDAEAAKRGTSVYLADRRIDMIPPLLSSNICSLHCNTDKLVFSVVWKLSPDAQILSTKYAKGIINSKASLTYAEAQARLNSSGTDEITKGLKGLSTLAQILKKRRFENGALMLSSAEVRDDGTMDSEESEEESHSMVEEFMLLANCSVAQFILQHFREFSLLRRHPSPPPANFDPLLLAAKAHGIHVVVDNGSKALNESIENCPLELRGILRVLTTRCMTQALYYCSGTTSPSEYSHFGLAVGLYTHFTSPIRRYADLMVHRLLAMAIGVQDPDPRILVSKQMHSICENINTRHRMAQYASRASHNYHKSRMLLGKQEKEFGYIMFIRRNALQIFVPNYGIEGFIFFPKDTSNFVYNEKEGFVTFGKVKLHALDKVKVELSLEEEKNKVAFKLLEPKIPGLND